MIDQFIVKFDYNIETLKQIAEEANKVDLTDIEAVKENLKKFVKIRTTIKKQEKDMVDGANKFRTTVFEKRDEYLAITEPIEQRFKDVITADENRKIMEVRVSLIPGKKSQLSFLDISPVSDDFILTLDDEQWVAFYQEKMQENQMNIERKAREKKNEEERVEREAQIKKDAEARAEIEKAEIIKRLEREKIDAIENEKKQAQVRMDKEKADEKARHEKELRDTEMKAKKEKEAIEMAERVRKEQEEKLNKETKYKKFLSDNEYNEKDFIIQKENGSVKLYKFVAEYK